MRGSFDDPPVLALSLLAAVVALFLSAPHFLEFPPQPRATSTERLNYFVSRICLPVLTQRADFEQLVAQEHLTKSTSCDIQECFTTYCTSRGPRVCFQAQSDRSCKTEVSYDEDFDHLTATVVAALGSSGMPWREVKSIIGPGPENGRYQRDFCNPDHSFRARLIGYRPGHILGYLDLEKSRPMKVRQPEFDLYISPVTDPESCIPLSSPVSAH
jgi:hypothetical protein